MPNLNKPKATSPLATWLYYLEHLHNSAIELGLERVKAVAGSLDLLKPAPHVFTVAGTNGKGTTCATLEAILIAAGYKVGVYSSPHLISYTERVRIQGQELTEQQHVQALAVIDAGRSTTSLTYFEFSTLSALYLFKQAQVDVVILEVGLGGRLDATNIIDPDVAVITSIALDHTDWLGPDRESIGQEKAGIFRSGKPAVVGEPDITQTIFDVAKRLGAIPFYRGRDWNYTLQDNKWSWRGGDRQFDDLPIPHIPLPNAATALAALTQSTLQVSVDAIKTGLANAKLPGRFETISLKPLVILDVGHNPHAAAYLAQKLTQLPKSGGKMRAVVGMLADKDIQGTLAHLIPLVDEWYCASLTGPRGTAAKDIAQFVSNAQIFDSVEQAWVQATADADECDTIVVFGSFHTVAEVIEIVKTGANSG